MSKTSTRLSMAVALVAAAAITAIWSTTAFARPMQNRMMMGMRMHKGRHHHHHHHHHHGGRHHHHGTVKFEVTCGFADTKQIDPIKAHGKMKSDHPHDFFGARSVNPNSTPNSIKGSATTCKVKDDAAAYWIPSLYRRDTGQQVMPTKIFAYYFGGPRAGSLVSPPAGEEVIAGNMMATKPQGTYVVAWSCGNGGKSHSMTRATPYNCMTAKNVVSQGLVMTIKFPYCWDGKGNQTANFTYGSDRMGCPKGFPKEIPHFEMHVHYGSSVGNPGFQRGDLVELASDRVMHETGGVTAHADMMFGWKPSRFEMLVKDCLNRNRDCGFLHK